MIDEKKLISHIENQYRQWGEEYTAEQILGDIEDFPKVGEWIPVEEREPSCSCTCLTWVKAKTTYSQYEKCVLANYYDGFFDVFPYIDDEPNEVQILAWQPLPEPFKGD